MKFNVSAWYLLLAVILGILSLVFTEGNFFYIGTLACVILSRIEYLIKKVEENQKVEE